MSNLCYIPGESSVCDSCVPEVLKTSPVLEFTSEAILLLLLVGDLNRLSLLTLRTLPLDFLLSYLPLFLSLISIYSYFYL